MATWEVVTDRLRMEQEKAERDAAEREAAAELARKVDVVLEVVRAAAAGDLTRDLTVDGEDAVGQLAVGLHALLETLRGSMSDIGRTADSLAVASEQLTCCRRAWVTARP